MYKLMITEDEEFIRKGIVRSIPWAELGFQVVYEARNGKDAIDHMEEAAPHVVLTDVRMPVMDGLELSRRVRTEYPQVEIVILSGFSDFAYAQEAIRFNVFEYLLKPTDKDKFINCFTRLRKKLDNRMAEQSSLYVMQNKMNEGLEKLREDFILDLLTGEKDPFVPLDERVEYLELDLEAEQYTVAIVSVANAQQVWQQWNKGLMLYAYRNIVGEVLSETGKSVAVINDMHEIILLLCFDRSKKAYLSVQKCVEDVVSHLKNTIYKNEAVNISAGIGLSYPDLAQVERSYQQARKALEKEFFEPSAIIYRFQEGVEYDFERKWIKNYPEEASRLVDCVVAGSTVQVERLVNDMFDRFLVQEISAALIKNYSCTLLLLLRSKLGDLVDKVAPTLADSSAEAGIHACTAEDSLRRNVAALLTGISREVGHLEEGEFTYRQRLVDQIKAYIHSHYNTPLSIADICEKMHISQSYLSNIFKAQTGQTCMEYVKQTRIQKSRELLKTTNLRVYEIAEEVGYSDYKYFVSQFKKLVGVSPSEYRDSKSLPSA